MVGHLSRTLFKSDICLSVQILITEKNIEISLHVWQLADDRSVEVHIYMYTTYFGLPASYTLQNLMPQ